MLGNYQQSNWDLCFRLFGIPVRITPMFWFGSVLLGFETLKLGPPFLMMWVLVCFLSILAHEMGHALVARWLGCYVDEAVLYMFGGLARYQPSRNHSWGKEILIALAGPGAGFLLWAIMNFFAADRLLEFGFLKFDPKVLPLLGFGIAVWLQVNLWWSVINMLPVLPLDGGHVCLGICQSVNRYSGDRIAHGIGAVVAGIAALYFFMQQRMYTGILFLTFAINNMGALQRR